MADEEKKVYEPSVVFTEYDNGRTFKASLGDKGLYDQNKKNERFFVGDQWNGAKAGNDRPLVRYNVIKRIGDYKMAVIGSNPIAVNYSADGVPNTVYTQERIQAIRDDIVKNGMDMMQSDIVSDGEIPTDEEINLVMSAMSEYYNVTAERVHFEEIKEAALRSAYCGGTGIVYTYWDSNVQTGLYADESRKTPIKGDIQCEVLDVENVYFGDPNLDDVQKQPYILIAQRQSVADLKREAKMNKASAEDIENIVADTDTEYMAGDRASTELNDSKKATAITKIWKEYDDNGNYTVMAVKVTSNSTIRQPWDIGVRCYPLAKFSWERRKNCAYGESEITYLIPNQIAINRMITASVWAVMIMGMPIMVLNGDIITQPVTNDPGQIIKVNGDVQDVANAIRYVNPPNFSPKFDQNIDSLVQNTLTQSGANDAALGDIRPDNTSAIIAVREAATMPLQMVQNRFYSFLEDIARIWCEFWVMQYGDRALKIDDESGTWYLPFNGDRYKDLLISVKVDVGASTLWSESQAIRTLDNLFDRQVIDVVQYLKRIPKGVIPNVTGLIKDLQNMTASNANQTGETGQIEKTSIDQQLDPQHLEMLNQLPEQVRGSLMRSVNSATAGVPETMPTGNTL